MPALASSAAGTKLTAQPHYRADIQGLRAVAVGAVLLFHLWPNRMPGGFVGVDVFFVISGFLITGHLLRESATTGSVRLSRLWSRRIARLLPGAFLVLAVVAAATFVVVPKSLWNDYFSQIRASAIYFENWQLAWDSVDYMAIGADATAVQHYWTLSVEEQFYVVWPLVIVVTLLLVRRFAKQPSPRRVILVLVSVVFAASFVYSIFDTATRPAWAFFSSFTRAWEFALGGIVALTIGLLTPRFKSSTAAGLLGWLGLAMIVGASFVYSGATHFPGYAALLPTVGAALILHVGDSPSSASPRALLSWRPATWLGGISYAGYLWHWPPIVMLPFITGTPLTTVQKLAILAGTLVLSQLSTRFVEDPLRRGPFLAKPVRAFAFAAIGAVAFAGLAFGVQNALAQEQQREEEAITQAVEDAAVEAKSCMGPNALDPKNQCASPMGDGEFLVAPEVVALQKRGMVLGSCQQEFVDTEAVPCHLGAPEDKASLKVAIAGDSHATQWFPGFDEAGKEEGWSVQTFGKVSCPLSMSFRVLDSEETDENRVNCAKWTDSALEQIEDGDADVVVLTSYQSAYGWDARPDGTGTVDPVEGFAEVFQAIADSGKRVVVIKAVPRTNGQYVAPCVEQNGRSLEACGATREEALPPDYMAQAVESLDRPDVTLINLDDQFCDDQWCYPVVGDVVVYRDYSHISAEWSRVMMPWLAPTIEGALD